MVLPSEVSGLLHTALQQTWTVTHHPRTSWSRSFAYILFRVLLCPLCKGANLAACVKTNGVMACISSTGLGQLLSAAEVSTVDEKQKEKILSILEAKVK